MLRRILFTTVILAVSACAAPVPEETGIYLRDGRNWLALTPFDPAPVRRRTPDETTTLRAIRAVAAGSPRLVAVGDRPASLAAFARTAEGRWEPFTIVAVPHDSRGDVTEIRLPDPAPTGLILLTLAEKSALGFVHGDDPWFFDALGRAEEAAGDFDAAEAAYRRALVPNRLPDVLGRLSGVLAKAGRELGEARSLAREAIERAAGAAERARYHDVLAHVEAADGNPEAAIEAVEKAILLDLKASSYHRHLGDLIGKIEPESPQKVLERFYAAIDKEEYGDAEDLAIDVDARRLNVAGRLKETFRTMARGGPWRDIIYVKELRHGRVTYLKYQLVGPGGARKLEDIQLQFIDGTWKVGLP